MTGQYKIHLRVCGGPTVGSPPGARHLVLESEVDDGTDKWDVAFDGEGGYTLRNVKTGLYLGGKSAPTTTVPMMEGVPEPFSWTIERSEEGPEIFTLSPSASDGSLRLSTSPLRLYPPPLAWVPPGGSEQLWCLVRV